VIEIIGYLASAGAMAMWLPQVLRAVRFRRNAHALTGISRLAYSLAAGA
jgi:hypothetical protein